MGLHKGFHLQLVGSSSFAGATRLILELGEHPAQHGSKFISLHTTPFCHTGATPIRLANPHHVTPSTDYATETQLKFDARATFVRGNYTEFA